MILSMLSLNTFLAYLYENNNDINLNYNQFNQPNVLLSPLQSCTIHLLDIFNLLNSFTSISCPGPDLIPSIFFKNCTYAFSTPLLYLFNLSLSFPMHGKLVLFTLYKIYHQTCLISPVTDQSHYLLFYPRYTNLLFLQKSFLF